MMCTPGRGDLVKRLRGYAEDPMWAAHAEVPKPLIVDAAARIEELEQALEVIAEDGHLMPDEMEEIARAALGPEQGK